MKILFTGSSSFTGYWFVRELAAAGHEVVTTFQAKAGAYSEVRQSRVDALTKISRPVYGCSFGSSRFLDLIRDEGSWDLLCHHAADVTHYKSADFDITGAVQNNTRQLDAVLETLASASCSRLLLTGSIFENDEGAGSDGLPAFSPYGLSKALTAQIFRYYAGTRGFALGKFVIPNPFGPFEEPRFCAYLMRNWFKGETPTVNTPAYIRDNIHISLLAKAYSRFAEGLRTDGGFQRLNPSGYPESNGAFAQRLADAMRSRLDCECSLELRKQVEFEEPRVRINTDIPDAESLGWNEDEAWDELAAYYRETLA